LRIPAIIRAESNALRKRPWWVRIAHRMLLSRFDAFLAIGKANRDFYLANGVDPAAIFPCRYFVDNERIRAQYEECAGSRAEIRAAWGIPPQSVCFLFAGKLQKKKRILDLLDALRLARNAQPEIHLLVAGSGDQMARSVQLAESAKLPVSFAGFLNQSKMSRAYAAADCLVLPSDFGETWGLVVNEAMVCGLPALVSDRVGCGPDLVLDGVTGRIFPFGNVSELARRMVEIAANPAGLRAMGEKARDHIGQYTVEKAIEGTIRAIDAVVAKRAKGQD
jgi:glycosyltransferase involved in cell wall biosynthesis